MVEWVQLQLLIREIIELRSQRGKENIRGQGRCLRLHSARIVTRYKRFNKEELMKARVTNTEYGKVCRTEVRVQGEQEVWD